MALILRQRLPRPRPVVKGDASNVRPHREHSREARRGGIFDLAIDEVRALNLVHPAKNLPASLNGATVVAIEEHSIGKRELPPF
ncbi:MAG: hypothetical protein WAV38_21385 [Xanthobacteraceae bacterium]